MKTVLRNRYCTNEADKKAIARKSSFNLNLQFFYRNFVKTHYIELTRLIENTYRMFHFNEQVENGKFFFNCKISEGPSLSRNAIKLLEIMNYPGSIISKARQYLMN